MGGGGPFPCLVEVAHFASQLLYRQAGQVRQTDLAFPLERVGQMAHEDTMDPEGIRRINRCFSPVPRS